MDWDIRKIRNAIFESRRIPNLRLFLMNEKGYLRIYNGKLESSEHVQDFGFVKNLDLRRGDVLDLFSKLEFLINELIQLRVSGFNSEKAMLLDDVLEWADLYSRIKLLEKWNVINKILAQKLMETKKVRNGLAHQWDVVEVSYKGKRIGDNFDEFKQDMEEIWRNLIAIYQNEQEKLGLDKLLNDLLTSGGPFMNERS